MTALADVCVDGKILTWDKLEELNGDPEYFGPLAISLGLLLDEACGLPPLMVDRLTEWLVERGIPFEVRPYGAAGMEWRPAA